MNDRYEEAIRKACLDHGITLTDAAIEGREVLAARFDIPASWLVGSSYQIGNEIVLGVYDDPYWSPGGMSGPEIRAAAFFHELGHRQNGEGQAGLVVFVDAGGTSQRLAAERHAWAEGFDIAATYGLTAWSGDVSRYIEACLETWK